MPLNHLVMLVIILLESCIVAKGAEWGSRFFIKWSFHQPKLSIPGECLLWQSTSKHHGLVELSSGVKGYIRFSYGLKLPYSALVRVLEGSIDIYLLKNSWDNTPCSFPHLSWRKVDKTAVDKMVSLHNQPDPLCDLKWFEYLVQLLDASPASLTF